MPTRLRSLLVALTAFVAGSAIALAQSSATPDATLAERLAERLLGTWGDPAVSRTELVAGAFPETLDVAVPRPESARLLGSVARYERDRLVQVQAVLDSPLPAEPTLDAFRNVFDDAGWIFVDSFMSGGFMPAQIFLSAQACDAGTGHFVYLTVISLQGNASDVRLDLNLGAMAYNPPCDRAALDYRPMEGQAPLPTLRAPADTEFVPHSTMQMPEEASSTGIATSDRTFAELAAHYAAQLAEAGWHMVETNTMGSASESTWTYTDAGGVSWTARLSVAYLSGTARRHALSFFVARAGA